MKKITTLLIALLMVAVSVLSFASCNALKTEEVINQGIENTSKLTDFEANMNMVIDMKMTSVTMNMPMNVSMKVKDADKENPITYALMSMEVMGQKIETESYMDGEYVYVVTDGEGYKTTIEDAEGEYDYSEELNENFQKLPEDLLKDIELVKGEDGSYSVTVNIPNETFKEIYGDLLDEVSEASLGEVFDGLTISDCVVTVTVKDDYATNYDLSFKMVMEVEGREVTADVTADYEIVNPGKSVTITPPQGYENFEEFEW